VLNIEVQPVIQKFSLRDLLKKVLSFSNIFYLNISGYNRVFLTWLPVTRSFPFSKVTSFFNISLMRRLRMFILRQLILSFQKRLEVGNELYP
jgi:hypothetical protein